MKNAKDWNTSVTDRLKVLHDEWLKDARKTVEIYEVKDPAVVPFNILYSNTETLLPALYNSTPRPEVSARYSSMDRDRRLDAAVAQVAERTLEYTADTNSIEYETFDEATRDAVLQALVPGQGSVKIKHKNYEGGVQQICVESCAFDRFVWAYARKWQHVPWVAYGHDLNKTDFEKQFPEFSRRDVYKNIDWKAIEEKAQSNKSLWDPDPQSKGKKKEPTLLVWEIWSYADKKIVYVCDEWESEFLLEEKYPFDMTSRFPSPKPLQFLKRINSTTPRPLYMQYESQAEELNDLTRRLKRIVRAIRVRGIYHPALEAINTLLQEDNENALIPAEQAQALTDSGGIEKYVWMLPTDQLVATAIQLYQAREQCKQVIYEIMGIGDILRGASVASETAKAQEIKNQWGSLRIKRLQKDVQVFCRDTFRIVLEYAANLYTPITFKQITNLPYLFGAQKQQLQMMMQKQQANMAAQQAQMAGQPPPQSPPPPPEAMLLAFPTWEEIIGILRGQFERQYRIDIETNSTVDLEATEDKAAIGEFMNAFGQMTAGLAPMVETGQLPFEASKVILGETFRRFRFGRRVQDALEMMQAPKPREDPKVVEERHNAEMVKVQAEAKRQIGEMQETVLEMTGEIERLTTELKAMKLGQEGVRREVDLNNRENKINSAEREHQLRTTFQGTVKKTQEQADQKVKAVEEQRQQQDLQAAEREAILHVKELGMQMKEQMKQMMEQMVKQGSKQPMKATKRNGVWHVAAGDEAITAKKNKETGAWEINRGAMH